MEISRPQRARCGYSSTIKWRAAGHTKFLATRYFLRSSGRMLLSNQAESIESGESEEELYQQLSGPAGDQRRGKKVVEGIVVQSLRKRKRERSADGGFEQQSGK
jgi:hypothetical protein